MAAASLELQQAQLDTEVLTGQLAAIFDQIGQLEQVADFDVTSGTTSLYQEAGGLAARRQQALDRQQSLAALIINNTSPPAPPNSTVE